MFEIQKMFLTELVFSQGRTSFNFFNFDSYRKIITIICRLRLFFQNKTCIFWDGSSGKPASGVKRVEGGTDGLVEGVGGGREFRWQMGG